MQTTATVNEPNPSAIRRPANTGEPSMRLEAWSERRMTRGRTLPPLALGVFTADIVLSSSSFCDGASRLFFF